VKAKRLTYQTATI